MKRFVFRVVTLATLLVLMLPVGSLAIDDAPIKPSLASGASDYDQFVYLPIIGKSTSFLAPIIPETTKVLDSNTTQHLVSVSLDGATFTFDQTTPVLQALAPGEIMVSAPTTLAPDGLLRRVTTVKPFGGQVVVQTQAATLEDAIQQGEVSVSKRLTPADIKSMTAVPGVMLVKSSGMMLDDGFFFDIKDVVLYDKDGNLGTTHDQIKANGSLELAPGFDFDLVVKDWALQELGFVFSVEESIELEFQTEVELAKVELKYELARLHLGTITVFVGPVPVVFLIEMPIYLRGDGKVSVGITTKVTQQAVLSAGLRYRDKKWSPVANLNNSFGFEPPRLSAGVELKGYIDPPLGLLLYGVAGPFAGVTPYLKLEADVFATPWWKLYGGLDATVGVKVEVLGHSLGDHTEVVIGYRILLAQATTPAPPPSIFSQCGAEYRYADNTNFYWVTFWGRLGPTSSAPVSGGYRMKISAPSDSGEVAFLSEWQYAYPGLPSEFRYNANFVAPRTVGDFRAVVVDVSGKEVSDPITHSLFDRTHDVILSWCPR